MSFNFLILSVFLFLSIFFFFAFSVSFFYCDMSYWILKYLVNILKLHTVFEYKRNWYFSSYYAYNRLILYCNLSFNRCGLCLHPDARFFKMCFNDTTNFTLLWCMMHMLYEEYNTWCIQWMKHTMNDAYNAWCKQCMRYAWCTWCMMHTNSNNIILALSVIVQ